MVSSKNQANHISQEQFGTKYHKSAQNVMWQIGFPDEEVRKSHEHDTRVREQEIYVGTTL